MNNRVDMRRVLDPRFALEQWRAKYIPAYGTSLRLVSESGIMRMRRTIKLFNDTCPLKLKPASGPILTSPFSTSPIVFFFSNPLDLGSLSFTYGAGPLCILLYH